MQNSNLLNERDELMRQSKFLRMNNDGLKQEINEGNATLAALKEEIAKHTAVRDYILEKETPNIRDLVKSIKTLII